MPLSPGFIANDIPPLLKRFPGAAAAYSLRKLRRDYLGDAIRVRRSSDNAEQDIGFSGGTLDTNALTSFVSQDGYVVTWYDQSGNNRDATQSTQADQPQIVSSGSAITQGGFPAIQTDHSNGHYLEADSVISLGDKFELFQVSSWLSSAPNSEFSSLFSAGDSGNDDNRNLSEIFQIQTNSSSDLKSVSVLWSNTNIVIGDMSDLNLHLVGLYASGGTANTRLDGNAKNSGSIQAQNWREPLIGSNRGNNEKADANHAEIVLYPDKKATNRSSIESDIIDHYGI